MFDRDTIDYIKGYCIEQYPKEACGFVIYGKFMPQKNIAQDPTKDFEIADTAYRQAVETGGLQAIIHSHPGGPAHLTEADMKSQRATAVPWGVVVCNDSQARDPVWFGDGAPVSDLIGREFFHGVHDCYSLIRDFYRIHKDIWLPDYPREFEWWEDGNTNLYEDNFRGAGFKQVSQSDLKDDDVILYNIRSKYTNHGSVYLGNGLILHHLYGRLSRREPAEPWMRYATHFLRYDP